MKGLQCSLSPLPPYVPATCAAREKFGWEADKADVELAPVLEAAARQTTQTRITQYAFSQRFAKIRSKRLQQAVQSITGRHNPDIMYADVSELPDLPSYTDDGDKEAGQAGCGAAGVDADARDAQQAAAGRGKHKTGKHSAKRVRGAGRGSDASAPARCLL